MIIETEMIHGSPARSRARSHGRRVRAPLDTPQPQPQARAFPVAEGWGEWEASSRHSEVWQPGIGAAERGNTTLPAHGEGIGPEGPIVPHAVAAAVCEEASLRLGEALPDGWVSELAERADVVCRHNARFRQLLAKPGNAGRDWLWAFARHWLYGLLSARRPDLCSRLPVSYAVGRGLV